MFKQTLFVIKQTKYHYKQCMLSFYILENFKWLLKGVVVDIGDVFMWANLLDFSEKTA